MGLWDRIKGILGVHTERVVSRMETPEVLAERARRTVTKQHQTARLSLHEAKRGEIEIRQQIAKLEPQAQVARDRAFAFQNQGRDALAEIEMKKALRLEQMVAGLRAQLPQLEMVNEQLGATVADLGMQKEMIGVESRVALSRSAQARALEAAATASYGDPKHPDESARQLLRRANDRADAIAASGQASIEVGQMLGEGDDDLLDLTAAAQAELAAGPDGGRSALSQGSDDETSQQPPAGADGVGGTGDVG